MTIGFIGFGKMGSRIVLKLLEDGHDVMGWNRSPEPLERMKEQIASRNGENNEHATGYVLPTTKVGKFIGADTIKDLVTQLEKPRIIWLMLPAGEATEQTLKEVMQFATRGDIIIDGGNAFYKHTQRRFDTFKEFGVRYLGIGVSGGVKAVDTGYPLMVGGDRSAFDEIRPLLDTLIKPQGHSGDTSGGGGYEYFGSGGAGHFVKMVHNGIEYGMMQAIGEGFGVLEKAPYPLDLQAVSKLWQKNTIVTSFLMECAKDALQKDPTLKDLKGVIDATGEAEWTVTQGKEEDVPVENIEQSLDFRRRSQTQEKISSSFAARMVAALRHEFGGHKVEKK